MKQFFGLIFSINPSLLSGGIVRRINFHNILCDESGILGHAVEGRLFVLEQLVGRCELCDGSAVQNDDLVRVEDGVQTMSNHQHGAVLELSADGFLKTK